MFQPVTGRRGSFTRRGPFFLFLTVQKRSSSVGIAWHRPHIPATERMKLDSRSILKVCGLVL